MRRKNCGRRRRHQRRIDKKRCLENDRDDSDKNALGTHTGAGGGAGEVDSRLYSQNAGLDQGFSGDDEYNTPSKPMFDREGGATASCIGFGGMGVVSGWVREGMV